MGNEGLLCAVRGGDWIESQVYNWEDYLTEVFYIVLKLQIFQEAQG